MTEGECWIPIQFSEQKNTHLSSVRTVDYPWIVAESTEATESRTAAKKRIGGIPCPPTVCRLGWENLPPTINDQQIKDNPTPNKNCSYGIKGGVRMPYFGGPYALFSVEISWF